jgi:hypothetical protein
MPPRIRIIAILICIFLVAYVFELVRRRHLNEEYSMGWLVAGSLMLILSISDELLVWVTNLVGATLFTSTLFFFGLIFFRNDLPSFFYPHLFTDQSGKNLDSAYGNFT